MPELALLDLPGGPGFVDALQRVWDTGDAAWPIDRRLPPAARARLVTSLRPSYVIDPSGRSGLGGGLPTEPGDAVVVATSGTTGDPKGVVLSHDSIRASAVATSAHLGVDPSSDRWLSCLPLNHVGGLAVVMRALVTGTPVDVHDGFDTAAVSESPATLTALVPTALARIDPAAFRTIIVGGSAVPADRPPNCVATYGMTETGSGCVYDGRPLDGVEIRIADGEIQLRCPMLLRAYRDGTDPRDAEGWYPTGDGGELRADGQLRVFGRRGDMIITGGENVWPLAVERLIGGHPAVEEVCVIGRPDPEWGQLVTAVMVPAPGVVAPSLDEVRDLVKSELASFAAPRAIELRSELPKTALGKVRRSEL